MRRPWADFGLPHSCWRHHRRARQARQQLRRSCLPAQPVTTGGGTPQALAKFDGAADIANSQIFDNGKNVRIGNEQSVVLDTAGENTRADS